MKACNYYYKVKDVKQNKQGAIDIVANVANSLLGVICSKYAEQITDAIDIIKAHLLRNQTSFLDYSLKIRSRVNRIIKTI